MPQAKDGGREMKKSLPQSNAMHLTALPSRGTRFCLRLGAPNKIDRFAHKCSLFPPLAAVTFVARQRGRKRRAIRESPLQPVGNGLDRSAKLHQNRRAGVETRPYGWIDKPQNYASKSCANFFKSSVPKNSISKVPLPPFPTKTLTVLPKVSESASSTSS